MTDEIYNGDSAHPLADREHRAWGQEVLIRAERSQILAEILPLFEKDELLSRVFLLVDGDRGQRQIAQALVDGGHGGSDATVSRKMEILQDLDLITLR